MSADDPQATWLPSSNYTTGREGRKVDLIIIHSTEAPYESALNWLRGRPYSSNTGSSSHYLMDANGGRLVQLVREADTAWTAGNWVYNTRSVNIEMEGYAGKGGFSDALYRACAALVARIAARHNIPLDRQHIIGHAEVPNQTHWDPGPHWDWNRFMRYVDEAAVRIPAAPAPQGDVIQVGPFGRHIGHGFLAFWRRLDSLGDHMALRTLGYPLTEEFSIPNIPGTVFQVFERGILRFDPSQPEPWRVHVAMPQDAWVRDWARERGLLGEQKAT